ncbi:hypothetical protein EYC84_006949 [Monilinia fructicola]|uniref:Uncharacterized protein n=1 Tax=Monilinia fructicola TaxID=38448 RepID=A0A5M9K8S7_MONFR|nr:hypothetical protein EYC84_006949 [Monilinia fructicola]
MVPGVFTVVRYCCMRTRRGVSRFVTTSPYHWLDKIWHLYPRSMSFFYVTFALKRYRSLPSYNMVIWRSHPNTLKLFAMELFQVEPRRSPIN